MKVNDKTISKLRDELARCYDRIQVLEMDKKTLLDRLKNGPGPGAEVSGSASIKQVNKITGALK